jgi:FKBP-type peptidyl-prolyl cis-trans isomerase
MNNRIIIFFAILVSILTTSCVKEQLETVYNKQEEQIDKYIDKAMITTDASGNPDTLRVVRNAGSNRLVRVEGTGEELAKDGYVSFYYAGYTFNGSVSASNMFGTNHQATAEQAGWNLTDPDYALMEINITDADLINGLKKGLEGVRAGEECEIIFSGKYGFGNNTFGMIPAKSALLYKIWVVSVTNE